VATSKNNPDIAGFRFLFRDNEGVLAALTFTAAGLILTAGAYYALGLRAGTYGTAQIGR
jgi:hypothetical protein